MSAVCGMIRFVVLAAMSCCVLETRSAVDAFMVCAPAMVATDQNVDGFFQSVL